MRVLETAEGREGVKELGFADEIREPVELDDEMLGLVAGAVSPQWDPNG